MEEIAEYKIKLTREDLGNCKRCDKPIPDDVELKYKQPNIHDICCHMHSESGWWVRVDFKHKFLDYDIIEKEYVGENLCPKCVEKYNEQLKEMFDI